MQDRPSEGDNDVRVLASRARGSAKRLSRLSSETKNTALRCIADALERDAQQVFDANGLDVEEARRDGLPRVFVDRLMITRRHLDTMVRTFHAVADLPDPVRHIERVERLPNGLEVTYERIPLGVVAMVFESRPSSVGDAVALALKTGNAIVLRGGSEGLRSSLALEQLFSCAAHPHGIPEDAFRVIPRARREDVRALLAMDDVIDLIVPRGGQHLIDLVKTHARMPVLYHGPGVCHLYIDSSADVRMATDILFDAKARVPGVCNATECVLVHVDVAEAFWRRAENVLRFGNIAVLGDERTCRFAREAKRAAEGDYGHEFLGRTLSAKVVDSVSEAITHIEKYGTRHTEAIVTSDLANARLFSQEVDAGTVIINGSTRLNEAIMIGAGGHLGISTTKVHAFGTMGVQELTTVRRVVLAHGHVRAY